MEEQKITVNQTKYKCKKCGYVGSANVTFEIDGMNYSKICFPCFAKFLTDSVGENLVELPSVQGNASNSNLG